MLRHVPCFAPDTTRSQKMGEKNGREYHFVTKEVFAYMVINHK